MRRTASQPAWAPLDYADRSIGRVASSGPLLPGRASAAAFGDDQPLAKRLGSYGTEAAAVAIRVAISWMAGIPTAARSAPDARGGSGEDRIDVLTITRHQARRHCGMQHGKCGLVMAGPAASRVSAAFLASAGVRSSNRSRG